MAELVGLVSAIVALVQVTAQTAGATYGYVNGVKRAPEDIRKFLDDLKVLDGILINLKDLIQKNPQSPGLQQLNKPLKECFSDMQELSDKFQPKRGWRKKVARFMWPLRGKETAEFSARLEVHKSNFLVVLGIEQLSRTQIVDTNVVTVRDELAEEARRKILNWLSPEDFDKKHVEISGRRQRSTGEWLVKSQEVHDWIRNNQNSQLLWGYGIPGAGKTFLSSRMVDYLMEEAPVSKYGVAYVYFDYKEREQQTPVQALSSLVKQLLCQVDDIPKDIETLCKKLERGQRRPRISDIYNMLLTIVKSFDRTFIICDALDECDYETQLRELLPLFHRMGRDGMSLFLTSREHPENIQDSLESVAKIEISARIEDITNYIEQKISENARARRLFAQGNLKDKVIAELIELTKGMFLLVRFHMEYLCQQTTIREILRELERLKTTLNDESPLDDTYNRAMGNLRDQHKGVVARALSILSWLVKARRTLTVGELQQALSVREDQTDLDELDITDRKTLLDVCASLVTIDEKSDTVRLAHYTVQEYILKNSSSIIPEDTDFKIVMACTTFISFDVFSGGASHPQKVFEDRFALYPFLDYVARELGFHLRSCSESLSLGLVLKFLEKPGCLSSYTQAAYTPRHFSHQDNWKKFPTSHRPLHVTAFLGHCSAARLLLERGSDIMARNSYQQTALHCAASGGHYSMIQLLLEKGADISATDSQGATPLHGAAINGYDSAVRLLLEKGSDVSAVDARGWSVLQGAIVYGHEAVVRLLLEKGVDISAVDNRKRTMLHWAAQEGDLPIVRLLLGKGADMGARDEEGLSILHFAAFGNGGDEPMVQLLLERGADIGARDQEGLTALHGAVCRGFESMVRLLLEKGADISTGDNVGLTSLHKAAANGYDSIIQLLLDKGANISTTDDERGWTALHTAAVNGKESVVDLLLEKGADIAATDKMGHTPLLGAICRGHEEVVSRLIKKGADISVADNAGRSTLHWAAQEGHELPMRLLLEEGADISALNDLGQTPLVGAAANGNELAVMLLLEKGANPSAADYGGLTALHMAAAHDQDQVLRLLLQAGANISAADGHGWTPLAKAAYNGHMSAIMLLLDRGADISVTAEGGLTPLHAAAYCGHDQAVRLLLERGAEISTVDTEKRTALHWAVKGGHELVVELLLEKGADPLAKDDTGKTALSERS